jgi:nicotinate-nucleotide adenylyltransferase
MRRIGIFGGSFNPIHFGHLVVAQEAWRALKLFQVCFVPGYKPPHKVLKVGFDDRCRMVELATEDNPHFIISRIEEGCRGQSFTVNTIRLLRTQYPSDRLYLLMGADEFAELESWRSPEAIFKLCKVVVLLRPGYHPSRGSRFAKLAIFLKVPQIEIASSQLRRRLRRGEEVRYLIPEPVIGYIKERGLYR